MRDKPFLGIPELDKHIAFCCQLYEEAQQMSDPRQLKAQDVVLLETLQYVQWVAARRADVSDEAFESLCEWSEALSMAIFSLRKSSEM